LHSSTGKLISTHNHLIRPDGFDIPYKAEQVHGISTRRATEEGEDILEVLQAFTRDLAKTEQLVGHNIEFDINIIGAELIRKSLDTSRLLSLSKVDTGIVSIEYCQLPGGLGGKLKMPRLHELYEKLFGHNMDEAHDAAYDVHATARCFFGLLEKNVVAPFDGTPHAEIEYEAPNLEAGTPENGRRRPVALTH
jgi:DNA polymerase-3 subunit alpha